MPSDALRHRVHVMQTEANVLDEHARLLSIFASELSSFASTLSFQSQEIYAQSDQLHTVTARIMAGGPCLDVPDSDIHYHVGIARVTGQAAHGVETIVTRNWARRTLHTLTKTLAGEGPKVMFDEQLALIRDFDSELEVPVNSRHQALAVLCRTALEMGEELKVEQKSGPEEDISFSSDATITEYGSYETVMEDAVPEYAVSREGFDSLKRMESSNEKVQEQLVGCCGTTSFQLGEEQVENGMHTWKPHSRVINSAASLPSPHEHGFSSAPEASEVLPAPNTIWEPWSNSGDDEDESAGRPIDEPGGQNSDDESEMYSANLPSYEEALTDLAPVQNESELIAGFLRNPYGMATRTDTCGHRPIQRSFVMEAAERLANPSLASAPLGNCAAAML